MLTVQEHQDLSTRLEQLLIAYAPASDKAKATGQLREILARVPVAEAEPDAPAASDAAAEQSGDGPKTTA